MNSFITSGAGFIGSATADALLQAGHFVMVYDSLVSGRRQAVTQGRASSTLIWQMGRCMPGSFTLKNMMPLCTLRPPSAWEWHRTYPDGYGKAE